MRYPPLRRMRTLLRAALCSTASMALSLLVVETGWAFLQNKLTIGKPFSLQLSAAGTLRGTTLLPVGGGQVKLTVSDATPVFEPAAPDSNSWNVTLDPYPLGYRVYRADLDSNGVDDLLIVGAVGSSGRAPSTHVTTMLFDRRGKPNTSTIITQVGWATNGLAELFDSNGNGRAELLIKTVFDYSTNTDGFARIEVIEADSCMWRKLDQVNGQRLPLILPEPGENRLAPETGREILDPLSVMSLRWPVPTPCK